MNLAELHYNCVFTKLTHSFPFIFIPAAPVTGVTPRKSGEIQLTLIY